VSRNQFHFIVAAFAKLVHVDAHACACKITKKLTGLFW